MEELTNAQETYVKILNEEINRFPSGFWTGEQGKKNIIECGKYLIEHILKWNSEDIKKLYNKNIIYKYKLGGALKTIHRNSPFELIDAIYPNSINQWELASTPKSYYSDVNNRRKVIDFLLLKTNHNLNLFTANTFKEHGVEALLTHYYGGSVFKSLQDVYPDKYKPWQLNYVPNGWWDKKENRIEAISWMLNELKWDDNKIKSDLTNDTFKKFNLVSMLIHHYDGITFNALNDAIPNRFKPWELKSTPDFFWDCIENRILTIDWIMKSVNKDIKDITFTDVKKIGLRSFLQSRYDNNIILLRTEYLKYKKM